MPFQKGNTINKGKIRTAENRRNIGLAQIGRKASEETKRKMSLAGKNKVWSEGHKKNISKAKIGHLVSEETRKKIGDAGKGRISWNKGTVGLMKAWNKGIQWADRRGEKHHNWQGGKTSEHKKIRGQVEYKLWRISVFERDNYTCIWCGARSGNGKKVILNADHIKPFAYFPELRFAIDNGRTLCIDCHKTTDTYLSKAKIITQENV